VTDLNHPETPKPAIRSVLVALMMAIFLGALDQTIVAVSMPAISAQFKDVSLLAWVISGYMVAMTVAVPIYGKLGDLYGRRKLMLFGMGLFTLASLFCGMAQSMEQLVLARILQGIGAGGMISVSQAIIGDIVPPRERGRYQGYFSSMYAVASVAGPAVGPRRLLGGSPQSGGAADSAAQTDHRLSGHIADDHRPDRAAAGYNASRPGSFVAQR
jgi:MFS family permease